MAFRNVLVISPRSPSNPDWEKFIDDVRIRNMEPPISLPRPPISLINITVCLLRTLSPHPPPKKKISSHVQLLTVMSYSAGTNLR